MIEAVLAPVMDLLRAGRYAAGLRQAEQILMDTPLASEDLGRVQAVICRCRIELGDHLGALSAALIAERLTRSASLGDLRERLLLDLMEALLRLGRYEEALRHSRAYLDDPALKRTPSSEMLAWRNLGVCYQRLGRSADAVEAFGRARALLVRDDIEGHSCVRSYLIKAYIQAGALEQVPALLAEGEAALRDHPEDQQANVAHLCDSADYQYASGHLPAARQLAELALQLAERYSWHRYQCRMLLGRIAVAELQFEEALRHIMTARAIAVQGQHYDLEADAAEMMYGLIRRHPESLNGDAADNGHSRGYPQPSPHRAN
jgi:hypothetical protein